MKTTRDKKQINGKEGMAMMKGAQAPSNKNEHHKDPPEGGSGGIKNNHTDSLHESGPFQVMVWD